MATPLMGYYAPADGADAGTWGSSWNASGSTYIDNNFAGLTTKTLSAVAVTLSASECRNQMLRLTGTLLAGITIDAGASLWNGIRCVENLTSGNFAVTLSYNGTCVIPQGRRCLVFLDSSNGPRIIGIAGSSTADPMPGPTPGSPATKSLFLMASPPSGWTQSTSLNDYALRLVSGTGAGTGGSTAFSTVFAQSATGSHTLTSNEIPSHQHFTAKSATSHTYVPSASNFFTTQGSTSASGTDYLLSNTASTPDVYLTSATGGGSGHTHTVSLQVQYADIIAATRD